MNTKQFFTLTLSLVMSLSIFAQKDQIKAADKAVRKQDFKTAISSLTQAESLIADADAKTQAKFYYLKGTAYYAGGEATSEELDLAIESYETLIKVEKEAGSERYSAEASTVIADIIVKLDTNARAAYKAAMETQDVNKYKESAEGFEKIYLLSKKDTSYLYNAAMIYAAAQEYKLSNSKYEELIDLGYTGIETRYTATSTVSEELRSYSSSKDMMNEVKLKIAKDPVTEVTESKYLDMIKGVALNYVALEDNDKALEFIGKARAQNPDDYNLIIEEGNIYFKMGDKEKFKEKLEEAIRLNPTNPQLYYNVGVMSMELEDTEGAKKNFEKCIELNPESVDAYNALGNLILKDVSAVQEEMNANGGNFAKYDKLKLEKLDPILKEALPYLEKAYEIGKDETVQKQLNSIYENLGMDKRI